MLTTITALILTTSLFACGDKDDTGTMDGGATDGGAMDGGTTDGGTTDGGTTDGGTTDGGTTDGGTTDGGTTDGGTTDGGTTDGGTEECDEPTEDDALEAVFTTSAPTLDGMATDAAWDCLPTVEFDVTANMVYTPEDADTEPAYPGLDETTVSVQSVYTDTDVYFLITWADPTMDVARYPWEKQADGSWMQRTNKDSSGHENTWYEDKLAMQWNIDSAAFSASGCFAGCHVTGDNTSPGKKYNPDGQTTDMWHWKSVRTAPNGQIDDKLISYIESGLCDGENCRVADTKTGGGYKDNTYSKYGEDCAADPDGTLGLPCFMGPTGSETFTDALPSLFVADMQTFADGFSTGDWISGMTTAPFEGSRADVSAAANYADGMWTLEVKRSLTTDAGTAEDVQFSDLSATYEFGIAVFDNTQINHAAHTGAISYTFRAE